MFHALSLFNPPHGHHQLLSSLRPVLSTCSSIPRLGTVAPPLRRHQQYHAENCRASRVLKRAQLVQWTFGVCAGRGNNGFPAIRSDDAPVMS